MFITKILILYLIHSSCADYRRLFYQRRNNQLRTLIELLIDEAAEKSQCIVSMCDSYYRRKVDLHQLITNNYIPMYRILIRENEEFYPPRNRLLRILKESKYVGCNIYLILVSNGLQVANFLRNTEEERLINAQGKFVIIYDLRIFEPEMRYLWNRIINVIFVRHYEEYKRRSDGELQKREWYDLNTIPFPVRTKGQVVTRYIDSWYQNRFRYGIDHFAPKTDDLRGQKLRVAVFEHIPAVTEEAKHYYNDQKRIGTNSKPLGVEFEMLLIIANVLNFKPVFYQPENIQTERWGNIENGTITGIFGEAKESSAVFYLGDLYYTMNHLQILELSWPYNTECLTFLTLESLTENSWRLLILPFKLYTWIALILTLFIASLTFCILATIYKYDVGVKQLPIKRPRTSELVVDSKNFRVLKNQLFKVEEWKGLYLFTDLPNSILYTYSMLVQVSLPTLPNAWSIRILIGWWWIFSILISVTYKASITASLANSVERVTIDSLSQLVKSSLSIGSWSQETKNFFINSSDSYLQKLSTRYVIVSNEQEAIAAVANGTLCYYENVYVLQRERVKRQILEAEMQKNGTQDNTHKILDHNLHIMDECVINMPISLGMDKHSPLKSRVDKLVKQIIEAGFVKKWLSDITQQSKVLELRQEGNAQKALVDLEKLQGAVVALLLGYLFSIIVLVIEVLHWKYIVLRNPNFNRYHLDVFYKKV